MGLSQQWFPCSRATSLDCLASLQGPGDSSTTLSSAHSCDSSLATFLLLQRLLLPSVLYGLCFLPLTCNVTLVWAQFRCASLSHLSHYEQLYASNSQTGTSNPNLSESTWHLLLDYWQLMSNLRCQTMSLPVLLSLGPVSPITGKGATAYPVPGQDISGAILDSCFPPSHANHHQCLLSF